LRTIALRAGQTATQFACGKGVITLERMKTKIVTISIIAICLLSFAIYVYFYEGKFAVEFGGEDARNKFVQMLKENDISYEIETDHLGRVWIVPDQSKREEYDRIHEKFKQVYFNTSTN
jgi:hypothetical protein